MATKKNDALLHAVFSHRCQQQEWLPSTAVMREAVTTAWDLYDGPKGVEVQFVLLNEKEHSRLHQVFLDDPEATDVMAFPYQDDDLYGEVLVNVDMALLQAKCRDQPPIGELLLYLIHGTLHLLGLDDRDPESAAEMRAAEAHVLQCLGWAKEK